MVLSSLFGKKKDTDKNRNKKVLFDDEPSSGSGQSSAEANDGNGAAAYPESAREMAQATARKIDQIESEMSREMVPSSKLKETAKTSANASQAGFNASANANPTTSSVGHTTSGSNRGPVSGPETQAVPKTTFMGMGTTTPSIGQSTDILLGDSMLSNAIELSDSIDNPAIEEAAILFAYGQAAAAVDVLSESLREGQSNHTNVQAWLMLLELYQVSSDKLRFESLAIDYALRFESSAPVWADGVNKPKVAPIEESSMPVMQALVVFDGALDSTIVPQLDRLKRLTPKHHTLYVDFSTVARVEPAGAELIYRMLTAFGKSNHVLVMQGAEHLLSLVSACAPQEASKSIWSLYLDLLRLFKRQEEFEEKSIEYCVAFEVSPPPWEPYSANIHVDAATTVMASTTIQAPTELPPNTMALTGELVGKAENDLATLSAFANDLSQINIDCSKLNRVDFTAAGALLNWAVSQQMNNKTIEFRKVSHLVGALFVVMGIHEVAQIDRR